MDRARMHSVEPPPHLGRRRLVAAAGCAIAATLLPAAIARAAGEPAERVRLRLAGLGPRLLAAGVVASAAFRAACARAGKPLDEAALRLLTEGRGELELDASNAHFALNFLWALGLANHNPLLLRGPMLGNGLARIPTYASTGGWTLGSRPVMEVYAHLPLVTLESVQQERLQQAAAAIHRPCCDNATSFPDCNHGMAMLGLLTLLAHEDRDVDALYRAAKTANGFWFPQETAQLAMYASAARGIDWRALDAREASSRELFSASGSRAVAAWLQQHGHTHGGAQASCSA